MRYLTVEEWEGRLGSQVRELRLRRNISQERLGALADVSTATIHRLEAGQGSSVSTLVKVVRALGRDDWLTDLAPPALVSTMQVLRERRAAEAGKRQRASRSVD